ncbi:MAG TPA: hypothetical protein PKZ76_17625 [Xanthomonadaceae bacterium]|nr:hypothetical protein [Xanthomonadaceae bacterium]
MAISNKPLLWLPFAVGGTLAALLVPALMLVFLIDAFGQWPAGALTYERVIAFVGHPLIAAGLFVFITLLFWHSAHRLRMTLQDLGVRRAGTRRVVALVCYVAAVVGTGLAGWVLFGV